MYNSILKNKAKYLRIKGNYPPKIELILLQNEFESL